LTAGVHGIQLTALKDADSPWSKVSAPFAHSSGGRYLRAWYNPVRLRLETIMDGAVKRGIERRELARRSNRNKGAFAIDVVLYPTSRGFMLVKKPDVVTFSQGSTAAKTSK